MRDWLDRLEAKTPECLTLLTRQIMTSPLNFGAVFMGLSLCALQAWDTIIEGHGFNAISFGTAAASIITSWGVLSRFLPGAKPETSGG